MPLARFARDVAAMMRRHFSSVVVYGGATAGGILSWRETIVQDGTGEQVVARRQVLSILTDTLGDLVVGNTLRVDGDAFTIMASPTFDDDGRVTDIPVSAQRTSP